MQMLSASGLGLRLALAFGERTPLAFGERGGEAARPPLPPTPPLQSHHQAILSREHAQMNPLSHPDGCTLTHLVTAVCSHVYTELVYKLTTP